MREDKISGPADRRGTFTPSANVTTQAGSTEGAFPVPVPSTETRGGRSWTVSRKAQKMVRGEVYHALRREGMDKEQAQAISRQAEAWCKALPPRPVRAARDPRLARLYGDRGALAQAVAFAWLMARERA